MANRLSGSVMGIPISTRGLLLSKPYEPHFPLSTSKIKGIERKDSFSVRIRSHAGAIASILFMTTERLGFCSEKSLQTYSTTGELLKFQYKVSIPLEKLKGVGESMNSKKPSKKFVELATMDDFSFSKASASKSFTDLGKKRVVVLDVEKANNDVLFQNKSGSETPIILSPQEAQADYESRLESLPLELLVWKLDAVVYCVLDHDIYKPIKMV
ncbi:hypothetical protein L6452_17243 [Arctium lappa]|uniref:Uncharacterized protein n=1 Tax=Arctium lappa TaxID=4217 RepID=A0ACB9C306_ARCLA|nr:hypothetical protein L6452_17243 [Arctium lappa]